MKLATPNIAFVLSIIGLAGIYAELIWPGRRFAGIGAGAPALVAGLTGAYFLWLHAPTALGLQLLGGAGALFALDAMVNSYGLAGVAGTAAMAAGFWKLFQRPPTIAAILLFPLCSLFGVLTMFLNYASKRARRNKRIDIP